MKPTNEAPPSGPWLKQCPWSGLYSVKGLNKRDRRGRVVRRVYLTIYGARMGVAAALRRGEVIK